MSRVMASVKESDGNVKNDQNIIIQTYEESNIIIFKYKKLDILNGPNFTGKYILISPFLSRAR